MSALPHATGDRVQKTRVRPWRGRWQAEKKTQEKGTLSAA
jgi:hypothetical protein